MKRISEVLNFDILLFSSFCKNPQVIFLLKPHFKKYKFSDRKMRLLEIYCWNQGAENQFINSRFQSFLVLVILSSFKIETLSVFKDFHYDETICTNPETFQNSRESIFGTANIWFRRITKRFVSSGVKQLFYHCFI